jgi:hypothetical protein
LRLWNTTEEHRQCEIQTTGEIHSINMAENESDFCGIHIAVCELPPKAIKTYKIL